MTAIGEQLDVPWGNTSAVEIEHLRRSEAPQNALTGPRWRTITTATLPTRLLAVPHRILQ